jgi:NO-binding membrane sensor protein with MHYT domain
MYIMVYALGYALFVCAILVGGVIANNVDSVGQYIAGGSLVLALSTFGLHFIGLF